MLVTCLGPTSSGKTTLLKKLTKKEADSNLSDFDAEDDEHLLDQVLPLPKTIPSVGVNQFIVPIETVDKKDLRYSSLKHFCFGDAILRDVSVTIRELGGAIAPLWPSYIDPVVKSSSLRQNFIFVIDAADPGRLAEAGVHLVDCLSLIEESKHRCKLLLLLSKVDLLDSKHRERHLNDVQSLLRISFVESSCKHVKLQVLEFSAVTGEGLELVVDWLKDLYYHPF